MCKHCVISTKHFKYLLQVHEHIFRLEEISEFASKEYALERGLASMENDWLPLTFEVSIHTFSMQSN